MEQFSHYLAYWNSKIILNSHLQASMNNNPPINSFEGQAFAAGDLVWPPRSYTCSFCRREFRSAQALGGHMNVHRRDRARLKQHLTPNSVASNHQSNTSSPASYPSEVCFLDSNLSPKGEHDSASRASAISALENSSEPTPFSSSDEKNVREEGLLSMGLNWSSKFDCAEVNAGKRLKTDVSSVPMLFNLCSKERFNFKSEVLGRSNSSLDDLDLELRLGDPPKVK
ncbi:hypothetical protein NMG60_11018474 [Bertholletia excelsa]